MPARNIGHFNYQEIPGSKVLSLTNDGYASGAGYTNTDGQTFPLNALNVRTKGVYILGSVVPQLASPGLQQ